MTKAGISIQPVFHDTHENAADAFQMGIVPFAVVRPDIVLPNNGLTVAILREEALIFAAPAAPAARRPAATGAAAAPPRVAEAHGRRAAGGRAAPVHLEP